MHDVTLVVFHTSADDDDPPLTRLLAAARDELVRRQVGLFGRVGVTRVVIVAGRGSRPATTERAGGAGAPRPVGRSPGPLPRSRVADAGSPGPSPRPPGPLPRSRVADAGSFGEALATVVVDEGIEACVVLGSGAVPLLHAADAHRLAAVARQDVPRALTNNRYSSDICAVAGAGVLRDLPALPSDNALPRWLEEVAGYTVDELPRRDRLGLDLDTPLDLALLALAPGVPPELARLAVRNGIGVPRLAELRALAADPRRELLVFGRSSSRTLAWLERHVRCRVRFLAEERGMRASSPLAMAPSEAAHGAGDRRPRATLGRLLALHGPDELASIVGDLADGAILDTRVLLADRLGADETLWGRPEDRFASDLLRSDEVDDPWLRALTAAAASSPLPILLGGHTLVGPGIPVLLRGLR